MKYLTINVPRSMDTQQLHDIARLLKSIAHPFRLHILCLLQEGEATVGQLRSHIRTSNANITQHLNILRNQGIITCRRNGNFIINSIGDERINHLIATLRASYCSSGNKT